MLEEVRSKTALERGCSNAAFALQMLLSAGLSAKYVNTLNAVGQTALHVAAEEDDEEEVLGLLSRGADVGILDGDGRSPLVTALVYRSWNAARAILNHGPDVVASSCMDVVIDSEGSTWLHHHPAFRHARGETPTPVDIFRRILDSGISPDIRDFNGNTPLHNMPLISELIQLLIEYNADVNAQNGRGETPLHVAFRAGNIDVVRCLLQSGADVNARDDFFNTPFHCDTSYYPNWKLLIPDLPQSIVRSEARNVFGARSVFHLMALYDSRPRSAQINTSYRDYIGNTALHVAARVCGHEFNKSNIIYCDDDEQEDLFSLKSEADLSVMNRFGHTPLHLKWLHLGFRLERDDFLHQKDGRGRTSWHHMFVFNHVFHALTYIYDYCSFTEIDVEKELEVLHMFPETPAGFESKRCFLKVAGCNEADDLGRTPLHYAAMQCMFCDKCCVDGCYLYCRCCIFLFGIDSWSVRDKWSRIPLHYAYLDGFEMPKFQIDMLPVELTDVDGVGLQDIDGYTPKQMLHSHMQYILCRQKLRNVESSCFADFRKLLQHCNTEDFFQECLGGETVDEHSKQLWPEKDATAFVWNIWTELQYAYRDPDYVTVHAAVLDFMSRLVVAIGDEDHRLEGILQEVGSSFEGTRVGFPDEFDFNIELVKLNSICDAVTFSECPNGFAYLIKKPGVSLEDGGCDQFFDLNGILLATAVSFWFQSTWIKVLSWQKFWDTEPLFEITCLSQMYIQAPNKLVKNITLRFNRPINGKILHYDISIDIVPVVRVEGWWPQGIIPVSSDIRTVGCNFVFDQPRRKHGASHSKKPYVRVSFARAESMSIRASPPVVRAAYMVAKQIVSQHLDEATDPQISSHTLKMAALWSVEETNPAEENDILSEHPYSQLEPHQLQRQVEALFRRLWQFSVQDCVPSFFMPSVRVAVWSFEKFPKYSHTFLRRIDSNYEKLFGSRVEPSRHRALADIRETRRNIRRTLAYSFALLHAVSSHNSWSNDWVFPTIIDDN